VSPNRLYYELGLTSQSWSIFLKSSLTRSSLIPDSENNRRDIFRKVESLEAFKAEKVLQTYRVTFEGRTVHGEPADGHVALAYTDGTLSIYFTKRSMNSRKSREELTELLHDFCGLDKTGEEGASRQDYKWLLSQILEETDLDDISDLLDRVGIPPLASDAELDEEYDRSRRPRWGQSSTSSGDHSNFPRQGYARRGMFDHAKEFSISVLSLSLDDSMLGEDSDDDGNLSDTSGTTLHSQMSARLNSVANVSILRQDDGVFPAGRRNRAPRVDRQAAFAAEKRVSQLPS
jgi:hypothetical protein